MKKMRIVLVLISFLFWGCHDTVQQELKIIIQSSGFDNIVISDKNILGVDWNHQSYLVDSSISKVLTTRRENLCFNKSRLTIYINNEEIFTAYFNCSMSPTPPPKGKPFIFFDFSKESFLIDNWIIIYYVKPEVAENDTYKDYYKELFNEKLLLCLRNKGLIKYENWKSSTSVGNSIKTNPDMQFFKSLKENLNVE